MKFTVKNIFEQTPLEVAMQTGAQDVYKYLMSKMGPADNMFKQKQCYTQPAIKHPPVRY